MHVPNGHTCNAECIKYVHKTNGFPQNKDGNIRCHKKKTFSHCTVVIDELLPCFIPRNHSTNDTRKTKQYQSLFEDHCACSCAAELQRFLHSQPVAKHN